MTRPPSLPPAAAHPPLPRRARAAVSVLFLANGALFAALLPRLPEIQHHLRLGDAGLGAALAVGSIGGVVAGPLAGPAATWFGTGRLAVGCALGYAPLLFLPGVVPTGWLLALALAWFGAADAVMDAAMNAHGLRVQQGYGRSIINSFHGFFSVGTVVGGLLGSASAATGLPVAGYLFGVGLVTAAAVVVAARFLLPGPDPRTHHGEGDVRQVARTPLRVLVRGVAVLGFVTLLAIVVEDVPGRWSSIYLDSLGAAPGVVGLGFVALSAAMTLSRFLGDRFVDRWGTVTVVRGSMAVTALGLAGGLAVGSVWAAVAAFAVVGLGVATLFPAAMLAAAHRPGIAPATGVAAVSWIARSGFFLAPLAVGALAEATSVAWGIGVAAAAAALLVLLAGAFAPERPRVRYGRRGE